MVKSNIVMEERTEILTVSREDFTFTTQENDKTTTWLTRGNLARDPNLETEFESEGVT